MDKKHGFKLRFLLVFLLLAILAAVVPPMFPKIPEPGRLTVEQNKMAYIAGLINSFFQANGNMPATMSEIQDWAGKEKGLKKNDPAWCFEDPNNGEANAWIFISSEKSFILRSPQFKIGEKECWLEQNETNRRIKYNRTDSVPGEN